MAELEPAFDQLRQSGVWQPFEEPLGVGPLVPVPAQFAPPDSTASALWNKVLKNNFWSGSYVFEWIDPAKTGLPPLFDNPPALQELSEAIQKEVPFPPEPKPAWAEEQRAVFAGAQSNLRGLRLEFRMKVGQAGWTPARVKPDVWKGTLPGSEAIAVILKNWVQAANATKEGAAGDEEQFRQAGESADVCTPAAHGVAEGVGMNWARKISDLDWLT